MSKVVPRAELLPCPFCGEAPELTQWDDRDRAQVGCDNEECGVCVFTDDDARPTQGQAIAAWNTRAPAPPPATPVQATRTLTRCPDGCFRPKATNADDCAAGCCSKWYAVNDAEAAAECSKLASFWRDPSIRDDAKLWRFCEQSGFQHASYGPAPDGKWRTYWFHRKARGEEFDDPISSVRAAIAREGRSND